MRVILFCLAGLYISSIVAEKQDDTTAVEKFREGKNRKIEEEGLKDMEAVGIVMAEIQRATQLREVVGLGPEELEARYKEIYSKHCQ